MHDYFGWFALACFGCDGGMDGEGDGAVADGFGFAAEDIEAAVDGEGYNGKADFVGEHEGTALEGVHLAVVGACAFGEDNHGHASAECFACLLYGFGYA